MRTRFRSEDEFKRWMRWVAVGVSAATAPACGRVESHELSVIPNAQIVVARRGDAGVDAGLPDAGGFDAGQWTIVWGCDGYALSTSQKSILFDGGGLLDPQWCLQACPQNGLMFSGCQPEPVNDLICWYSFCGVGRLTDGVQTGACGEGALGSELANMASHEAGAALAFAQLALELDRHGVPSFSRRARRAAREEVRHAQLVGGLARAHGGRFGVTLPIDSERTLEALAVENAAEGCVRETLGALIGLHQARHASDPAVRGVMAQVSRDELGHAAWSHALAEHLDSRLSLAARRRVREAREVALAAAARELSGEASSAVRGPLGLPDAERVQSLGRALRAS